MTARMVVADYASISHIFENQGEFGRLERSVRSLTAYRGLPPRHKLDEVEVVATG